MHRIVEEQLSNADWQLLRQQAEALRNDVETLSRQVETGGVDIHRLQSAGQLSHAISLALFSLQQREMESIREERDRLMKDFLERERAALRFENVDLAQLKALAAGPVELLD
ncbi:MAG TPA: hypothetical protein VKE98_08075 [Gemmataceae bacterium]|nr:hypothetical protein [Gemmataceae bacterium]